MSRCRSAWIACLLAAAPSLGLQASGCAHSFDVEQREVPVHVWLTIPALAERGGQVEALIYVGPYKVVQGPIQFPAGTPTVNLPALFIRSGERVVSAVIDHGRASGSEAMEIESESWIQVIVRGRDVSIELDDEQPSPWGP